MGDHVPSVPQMEQDLVPFLNPTAHLSEETPEENLICSHGEQRDFFLTCDLWSLPEWRLQHPLKVKRSAGG